MNGIERIAAERKRQIEQEGFTAEKDDFENDRGQLAKAAACYALPFSTRQDIGRKYSNLFTYLLWPWSMGCWKPDIWNRIRELEKAGALIAAEIDRLLRMEK